MSTKMLCSPLMTPIVKNKREVRNIREPISAQRPALYVSSNHRSPK